MPTLKILLFRIARSPIGSVIIGWLFEHMNFAIPVQRLRETPTLIAFPHPQPSHAFHILLVPKRAIGSLMALTTADADFMNDLFATVQSLVAEHDLEASGYSLLANGGEYQDVAQLHFHLISEAAGFNL